MLRSYTPYLSLTYLIRIFKHVHVTTSGQNDGREVFTRKMERPDNGEAYSLAEIQMHRQRHVELEKEFILSTLITLLKTTGNKVKRLLCLYLNFIIVSHSNNAANSPPYLLKLKSSRHVKNPSPRPRPNLIELCQPRRVDLK